jgi:hypothetical protein
MTAVAKVLIASAVLVTILVVVSLIFLGVGNG